MTSSATDRFPAAFGPLLLVALAASPLPAQELPTLRAAFAARSNRLTVPAIDWLCAHYLPARPEWPAQQDWRDPFVVTLSATGLTIGSSNITLPADVAAAGSCSFGDARPMVWSCTTNGTEDWFVPHGWPTPASWRRLLGDLRADGLDEPRSLDTSVVVGHLAGALVDGDPRGELLRLGSSLCGQVAWTAWTLPGHARVRGRSDGGLLLPALLMVLATDANPTTGKGLSLRAFAARDGDRAEAARQFCRTPATTAAPTLRALLHAEDAVALAAIDTIVRLRLPEELPHVVAAARPEAPWAQLAAADALRELWTFASPEARARTRTAVARSTSLVVRQVDLDRLPVRSRTEAAGGQAPDGSSRARTLLMLGLLAIGLYGLWSRERARLLPTLA